MNPHHHISHLIDQLHTAIFVLDKQLCVVNVNPAAENLILASWQSVQGQPLQDIMQFGQDLIALFSSSLQDQQSFTNREIDIKIPSHGRMQVDLTGTPTDDGNHLILEIHQRDRFARLRRDERIHNQRTSSTNLVRNLAHEIKNPLGGIRGAAQLLENELSVQIDDRKTRQGLQEYTQVIIAESNRLRDLVDRLLGPQRQAQKYRDNIHQVLDKTIKLLRAEAGDNITLRKDYDPSLPNLMLDTSQMMQVLLNIARNALQALTEGNESNSANPEICFSTRSVRNFTIANICHRLVCHISICDNGPGISDDVKDEIFFPMISTRPQGTGLGLSIAQSLIAQHQGLIECDSKPRHTCFNIYIPMGS